MNHDGLLLFSKILASPEPPRGRVAVLSAMREGGDEQAQRIDRARSLSRRLLGVEDVWMLCGSNTYAEAMDARERYAQASDLIIVTSAYHQIRAFLTFVRAFGDTSVKLWNAPAPSSWEKLEGELQKITGYQLKGHVAGYAEGLEHLAWRDAYTCVAP